MAATPPWVLALLQRWGVRPLRVALVAAQDCSIYRCRLPGAARRQPAPDLALRIYPAGGPGVQRVDFEAAWLQRLSTAGLWVPSPQVGLDGRLVQTGVDDQGRHRHAQLLTWLAGQQRYASLRPLHLWRVGRLLGHMHRLAPTVRGPGGALPRHAAGNAQLAPWAEGRFAQHPWLTPHQRRITQQAATQLLAQLAACRTPGDRGLIHGDLHCWNLVFQGDQAGAIDFSDGGHGPWLQDLASVLQFLHHPLPGHAGPAPPAQALQQALLDGYAAVRPLPPATATALPAQVQERMLRSLGWMLRDWPRPDARAWGPPFVAQCTRSLARWMARGD